MPNFTSNNPACDSSTFVYLTSFTPAPASGFGIIGISDLTHTWQTNNVADKDTYVVIIKFSIDSCSNFPDTSSYNLIMENPCESAILTLSASANFPPSNPYDHMIS